jgi:hypothetical protein
MEISSRWTPAFLQPYLQETDPLADETMSLIIDKKGPEEAQRLFGMLIGNIEMPLDRLPPEIKPYLEQTRTLPAWADAGAIDEAHRFFVENGPKALFLLYFKSLPLLYCIAKGAAVLVQTGRLTNKDESLRIFARRIGETGQFLMDVMGPGSLQAGGRGIAAIQKIRLIHASIRQFVRMRGWDGEKLDQPINQLHQAITLTTFSAAILDGMAQFGMEVPEQQRQAYNHTWNAIGYNLGIAEPLLPESPESATELLNQIMEMEAAPSEEGQLLAHSLVDFAQTVLRVKELAAAPASIIRFLIGDQRARMVGLGQEGCLASLLPLALLVQFRLVDRFEDKMRGRHMGEVLDFVSRQVVRATVGYFEGHKDRNFRLPDGAESAWLEG